MEGVSSVSRNDQIRALHFCATVRDDRDDLGVADWVAGLADIPFDLAGNGELPNGGNDL